MARRTLPPLNGLRAFEAAARLGGFAAAADELGVTAGAVSQRVRNLEQRMGVALFQRYPQSLAATRTGRGLLPVLTQAFDAIDAAVRRARAPAAAALPLRVACPAGFAAGWLLPRLDRFHQRTPSVALILTATERVIEPGDGDGAADAAIRFGRAGWSARLGCAFLLGDRRIPVCSPHYLAGHPIDAAGADPLAGHTLLEALSVPDDWRDWSRWTSAPARDARRLSFGDERLTMDAAERGLGLALADRALVVDALAAVRLVAPFEPTEMRRGTAWFLVYPVAPAPASLALAAFRDWLLEETDRSAS